MTSDQRIWDAYNDFHFVCDTARMQKLFARHKLFQETADLPGHIIDAGVFKGTSLILFAHMLKTYTPQARKMVIGFDTFEAEFQAATDFEKANAKKFMSHHQSDIETTVRSAIATQQLDAYCKLVKGDICETLPAYVAANRGMRISLLHLDLDIYKPTLEVLRNCFDLVVPGGLVVLDQYGVEGWGEAEAVSEFFKERQIRPRLTLVEHTVTPTAVIRL